jgi:5-hydroxyisourate hydrolase
MSPITTHILDLGRGKPAAGVGVVLEIAFGEPAGGTPGRWRELARGSTDPDGRCRDLLPAGALAAGTYRLIFATGAYQPDGFFPEVTITFQVRQPDQHHHVPLLLSPFGYSTYRGS